MERSDDEIRLGLIAYLKKPGHADQKALFGFGSHDPISPRELAQSLENKEEPLTSEMVRMARQLGQRLGRDPVELMTDEGSAETG